MNSKTSLRFWMNMLMIALVLTLLANELVDNMIHEILGIFICFVIIVHNILNISWYKNLLKQKYDLQRTYNFVINILLFLSVLTVLISGIITSEELFVFLDLQSSKFLQKVHMASAYWFVIFIGLHLGVQLQKFLRTIKKVSSVSLNIETLYLKWVVSILVLFLGIYASFERGIGNKLFMKSAFDFWDFDENSFF